VTGPLEELGESNLPPGEHVGPEGAADAGGEVLGVRLYPEWDYQIEDYKDDWCRVIEERLPEGSSVFADETLARHGTLVNGLKRQFQRIRREELEKLRRQAEGDELDLEALTEALIERRSGHPPSERLYIKRQKQLRDVAVAFLVDLSSSTHQSVQGGARTILDIEKESLLLMAEALESLGDPYAIYGFSGYGRQKVSFYVAREFGEPYTRQVRDRVGGMTGRLENRDGAAIRHAVRKLMAQPARVRLLFLLSDGRPLDCGCRQYVERYAQEDTRMALREARMQGVHPFCITVDRFAQRYLSRMYGQVHYTIIDQVTALPGRLPVIYRRLTT
jgi:nitric oxide reductase activation protein